jgi:hypothetical protein
MFFSEFPKGYSILDPAVVVGVLRVIFDIFE